MNGSPIGPLIGSSIGTPQAWGGQLNSVTFSTLCTCQCVSCMLCQSSQLRPDQEARFKAVNCLCRKHSSCKQQQQPEVHWCISQHNICPSRSAMDSSGPLKGCAGPGESESPSQHMATHLASQNKGKRFRHMRVEDDRHERRQRDERNECVQLHNMQLSHKKSEIGPLSTHQHRIAISIRVEFRGFDSGSDSGTVTTMVVRVELEFAWMANQ